VLSKDCDCGAIETLFRTLSIRTVRVEGEGTPRIAGAIRAKGGIEGVVRVIREEKGSSEGGSEKDLLLSLLREIHEIGADRRSTHVGHNENNA